MPIRIDPSIVSANSNPKIQEHRRQKNKKQNTEISFFTQTGSLKHGQTHASAKILRLLPQKTPLNKMKYPELNFLKRILKPTL